MSEDRSREPRDRDESIEEPMIDEEPDEAAVEEPIDSEEDAEAEAAWATHELASIATFSIAMTLLFALALLQATGVVELFAPYVESETGQWAAFALLALAVVGGFLWSRRGV